MRGADGDDVEDGELVDRAREGDLRAYDRLVRRYLGQARRTAAVLAGPADADDIVQDAVTKAYLALDRFDRTRAFMPWLLRIVTNEALNTMRSARRRAGLAARLGESSSAEAVRSAEEDALTSERYAALLAALARLPERYRQVVACRYLLEMPETETADVLGLSPGTVKSRLSRALAKLRHSGGVWSLPGGAIPPGPCTEPAAGAQSGALGRDLAPATCRSQVLLAVSSAAVLAAVVTTALVTHTEPPPIPPPVSVPGPPPISGVPLAPIPPPPPPPPPVSGQPLAPPAPTSIPSVPPPAPPGSRTRHSEGEDPLQQGQHRCIERSESLLASWRPACSQRLRRPRPNRPVVIAP
ncbi:hypothetical protein ALI144C_35970 [Actinosynnema sp. ALI-1.44]|nr:hypothetical protein ALI144C_35970 [Actinosynnema sp. ALI-1.44]